MLRILHASSTRVLLDHLVDSLARPGDPALRRPVLLPSRPLAERVEQALARRQGVAMGFELLLPAAFLERVALGLNMPPLHPSWSAEGMFWRVLALLPRAAAAHPARLGRACDGLASRTALAREIADQFDQYLHFRPDLIKAWDRGLTFNQFIKQDRNLRAIFGEGLPQGVAADEAWQMELWRALVAQLEGHPHPAQRLDQMAERAAAAPVRAFEPALEVLATGPLPFPVLKTLAALGRSAEVNLRVLLPANAYLGDVQSRWRQLTGGQSQDLDVEGNPLVAQMGRQAIEAFMGLMQLEGDGIVMDALDEPEAVGATLLARLQADVRALRQPLPAERPVLGEGDAPRSLRVHRCHGARREMEVLRDELLAAFAELPGLKPQDILILAPDLDLYGPLAEAAMAGAGGPAVDLGLAERRLDQRDPLLKAVLALLDMASGRCALSELLALLELPAAAAALGDEAAALLPGRLEASGLTFGLNAEHRRDLGAGDDATGTWRAALDRLMAGLWLGRDLGAVDAAGLPALAVAGDLASGRQALKAGLEWCDAVLNLLDAWRRPVGPAAWAARLDAALEGPLAPALRTMDPTLCLELANGLRQAQQLHACGQELDAQALAGVAQAQGGDETRLVAAVGGRATLGGLKPLRALPCRVLALVGLSDAAFPRRGSRRAWDLLAALPMPGDRDPRKDDRQLFLDCLLAAEDRVIVTAPARNLHTDAAEPLSACVEELLAVAVDTLGEAAAPPAPAAAPARGGRARWRGRLALDHALQPFGAANFTPGPAGLSHDASALALARALRLPRAEAPFAQGPCAAGDDAGPLDAQDVLAFVRDPAKAFLRARGMALPQEPDDPSGGDDEPVDAVAGLEGWRLRERVLDQALHTQDPHLVPRLAADRLLAQGLLGRLRGDKALARGRALAEAVRRAAGGEAVLTPVRLELGPGALMAAALPRGAGGPVVGWALDELERERGGWKAKPGLKLEAWSWASLAALAGDGRPARLVAMVKDAAEPAVLQLPPVDAGRAAAHWRALWGMMLAGRGELPCFALKTSFAIAEALRQGGDPRAAAEQAWLGGWRRRGEGEGAAMALAWRGQDPLAERRFGAWRLEAERVAGPILDWWAEVAP